MRSVLLVLALLAPNAAHAQRRIDLGDGAAVEEATVLCSTTPANVCRYWQPAGTLSFGDHDELTFAETFARSPSGRIFAMVRAMVPYVGVGATYPNGSVLLYTDDLGGHWSAARWPDPALFAAALAFDPGGEHALAVSGDGSIWSSDDDGRTWERRRSSTGVGFTRAWIRGRTCVLEDREGALWISRDRGFALQTLADAGARVEERGDEVVVIDGARTTRIDARGVTHRE